MQGQALAWPRQHARCGVLLPQAVGQAPGVAGGAPVEPAFAGHEDDAQHGAPLFGQGYADGKLPVALDELFGSVEGVDYPQAAVVPALLVVFV